MPKQLSPSEYQGPLRELARELEARVLLVLPDARVEHIGSSAVDGLGSKGDLDLFVGVEAASFEASLARLLAIGLVPKEGSLRTPELCNLVVPFFDGDVAVQLVANGSRFEDFLTFRDALRNSEDLRDRYGELKRQSEGWADEVYRARKSAFIEAALGAASSGAPVAGPRRQMARVALLVRDYDEAIEFFTDVLGFELVEDTYVPAQDKRWVVVAPSGRRGCSLVLARPSNRDQEAFVGNQTGGRVSFFLSTSDFWGDYERLRRRGVVFVRDPSLMEYGAVAVFEDLYGNLWDLLGPPAA